MVLSSAAWTRGNNHAGQGRHGSRLSTVLKKLTTRVGGSMGGIHRRVHFGKVGFWAGRSLGKIPRQCASYCKIGPVVMSRKFAPPFYGGFVNREHVS